MLQIYGVLIQQMFFHHGNVMNFIIIYDPFFTFQISSFHALKICFTYHRVIEYASHL